jgi:hypothetical protein
MKITYTRPAASSVHMTTERHAYGLAGILNASNVPADSCEAVAAWLREHGQDDLAARAIADVLADDPDRAHDSELPVGDLYEAAEYEAAQFLPLEVGQWTPDQRRPTPDWFTSAAYNVAGLSHWRSGWDSEAWAEHEARCVRRRARHDIEWLWADDGSLRGQAAVLRNHAKAIDPEAVEAARAEKIAAIAAKLTAKREKQASKPRGRLAAMRAM